MYASQFAGVIKTCSLRSLFLLSLMLSFPSILCAQIEIERISLTTDATAPNKLIEHGLTSFDGRYYVFRSTASNLVKGGSGNMFVIDNQTQVIKRVLNGDIGASGFMSHISPNGRYLVFYSTDESIVEADANGMADIFLADLQLDTISLVSVDSNENQGDVGASISGTVSSDGRYVTFTSSATNLVDDDTNGVADLFFRDTQLGTTERIGVSTAGAEADAAVYGGSISGDGRYVAFYSEATTLVAGDISGNDVFLRDTQTDTTVKVNNRSDGDGASNGKSLGPVISADGQYILFLSNSSTIDPRPVTNYRYSIFKYNITTESSVQVSRDAPNNDIRAFGLNSVSNDGRYIIYTSDASNLVPDDTNGQQDVFLTDTVSKTTTRANVDNDGNQTVLFGSSSNSSPLMISGDGNVVLFTSAAENLVDNHSKGTHGAYVHNVQNKTTELMIQHGVGGVEFNNASYRFSASADGRYVTFAGVDLGVWTVRFDSTYPQIYMLDRVTGIYTLITHTIPSFWADFAINTSALTSYSSVFNNGQFVVFTSGTHYLVEGDLPSIDLFLYDIQTDVISIIADVAVNNGSLTSFAVSADGQFITFASQKNNLVPGDSNNLTDVFLYNTQSKIMQQLSVSNTGLAGSSDGTSSTPAISDDGKFVAFESTATNLVTGDSNARGDIFVRDIEAGETFRVSVHSNGGEADNTSRLAVISENGRYVSYLSDATNLVDSDTNNGTDVFFHDRQTGATTRVNVDSSGKQTSGTIINGPALSADGQFVAFGSTATDLVEGDTNDVHDVFIHDNIGGSTIRVNLNASGEQADTGSAFTNSRSVFTENGAYLLFDSIASNLVPDDTNGQSDIFRVRNPLAPAEPLSEVILGGDAGSFEGPDL